MLMYKEDGGFHNFSDSDVETAKKNGWVDGEPVRAAIISKKMPVAVIEVSDKLDVHEPKRRGRPSLNKE
jgi:hypothetical protein